MDPGRRSVKRTNRANDDTRPPETGTESFTAICRAMCRHCVIHRYVCRQAAARALHVFGPRISSGPAFIRSCIINAARYSRQPFRTP